VKLLVIDDEQGLRQSLHLILTDEGHEVVAAADGAQGLEIALGAPFDAVLCDVRMPAMDGREFLRRYRAAGGTALVIMMSAYGTEDAALAAMQQGAYDYVAKPFRADEIVLVLRKAEERERLRGEVESLRAALGAGAASPDIVAESDAMRGALDVIAKVAPHRTTVLLTGPSGTGKEVLARELHRLSPRADGPFVAVNCAAIPDALLESELFGHVRGSFTGAVRDHGGLFEQATGGTLLLDEIGDLPTGLQAKLLRVLQDGEIRRVGDQTTHRVDVRVVAATARDLEQDVRDGRFREDLYYRLNVVNIRLSPLRDRAEDVPPLIRRLLARHARRLNRAEPAVAPEAMRALLEHDWPGNVRELENALERAMVLARDGTIRRDDLPAAVRRPPERAPGDGSAAADLSLRRRADAAEEAAIRAALDRSGGNRRRAAELLGISVRTLFYRLQRFGIERP
jgi:two-component system, NtrC family, response regulator AtoC